MATDQRRFEVFVSSTHSDLREARQRVTMTLLECDAFPTGMEIFPATDDDAWTLIRRIIDGCDYYLLVIAGKDYYLLVIAGKYGSVDPTSTLSYTEMEYDYAVSAGKPVMAFLHGSPGQLVADQCESTDDRRTKLENFREKVQKAKHVKFWKSDDELAGQVSLTYNKFVRLYPATGWIRADQASSVESLKELLDAKAQIEELEAELEKAKTSAPVGTEVLAQGADRFEMRYLVSAETRKGGVYRKIQALSIKSPTWDELFAAIAPQLLQECEEAELQKRMETHLITKYYTDNIEAVIREAKEASRLTVTNGDLNNLKVHITADDFGTTLVQLTALGLICKSERKRSVSDTGTYWALTPYGETRTIQLRAIKRTSAAMPDPVSD
jgi:Domain of unknown function (DUF4062)